MSRPEIVDDVIAAAAAVPQTRDRLSEEARTAWAGQLAADVAAERRAAGITVAPEAALHRALQARTDELERVRRLMRETEATCMRKVHDITDEAHCAVSRTAKERDDARAELERVMAERDSALADRLESATRLEALESERRTVLAMVEQHAGGSPRLVDEVRAALRSLARERDAAVDEVVRLVRARDEARASIAHFAEAAAAHDANADVFVDDEYHISTRALVEEFCREHGHPLAHEWATAKINAPDGGAPTAPDVALPCAPAAGAADPLRLSGLTAPRPLATWWPASDIRGPRP